MTLVEEINNFYPAILTDESLINGVLAICYKLYKPVVRSVFISRAEQGFLNDLCEEAMQEAAIRLTRLCKERLKEKELHKDFYAYIRDVYKYSAFECLKRHRKYSEYEGVVSEIENPEGKQEIIQMDDTNPQEIQEKIFERENEKKLGRLLMQSIADTKEPPHRAIAFCYSVVMPELLKQFLENQRCNLYLGNIEGEKPPYPVTVLENVSKQEFVDFKEECGEVFLKQYSSYLKKLKKIYGLPLEKFYIAYVILPELRQYVEKYKKIYKIDETEIRSQNENMLLRYEQICQRLEQMSAEACELNRNSLIRTECAKLLMDLENIGSLSTKFALFYNTTQIYDYQYEWGNTYKKALELPYEDKRNHISLPVEKTIVFQTQFSEEGKPAVLGKNIDRFSRAMRESLIYHAMERNRREYIFERTQEMNEKIEKAYRRAGGKKKID